MFLLNDDNFELYALKSYEVVCIDRKDFHDDLKRIKYIRRLFNRYYSTGVLRERLILNHIIMFINVFGVDNGTRFLFFKINREFWPALKTFLVYLNYMPDRITGIEPKYICSSEISLEQNIVDALREI